MVAVFFGVALLRLNISQVENFLQDVALRNGWVTVSVTRIPAAGNGGETDADQTSEIVFPEKPLDSAGLPSKLTPTEKTVTNPAISEMPEPPVASQISGNGALTREGVINATNGERQANLGAGFSLAENSQLDIAAANKVKDMFSGQYFEHLSPAGKDVSYFVGQAGYEYIIIGENLALGDYESDADLVKAWMDSPGHRENILKPGYKEIGVAVGFGIYKGRKTWLAVQEFGTPKSACPEVNRELSAAIDAGKKAMDQFSERQSLLLAKINEEKARAAALEKELNDLIAARASQGAIKTKYEELNAAINAANLAVGDYNRAATQIKPVYDAYKIDIGRYNSQVNAYNACADAFE